MSFMASLICVRFVFVLCMQLLVINSLTFDFQCLAPSTIADLTKQNIFCGVQVTLNDQRTNHRRHPLSLIDHSRTTKSLPEIAPAIEKTSLYPPTQTFCGFDGMCHEHKVIQNKLQKSNFQQSDFDGSLFVITSVYHLMLQSWYQILPNQQTGGYVVIIFVTEKTTAKV